MKSQTEKYIETEKYTDHEVRIRLQEERHADLKDIFNKIEGRFTHIEEKFMHIEEKFMHIDEKFMHLDNKMTTQFYWMLGTMLAITLAIVSYLIAK